MEELASGVAKRKVEKKTEKISLKKIEKAEEKDKSLKTVKAVKKQMMGKVRISLIYIVNTF